MADTYEKVMTKIVQSDYKEINNMIIQFENVQFRNRDKGEPQYLYWASYITGTTFDKWISQSHSVN